MKNVLIITESNNFMVSSLVNLLEENSYNPLQVSDNVSELEAIAEEIDVIVIHVENLLSKKKALIYLKDMAVRGNLPVVIMGELEQIRRTCEVIPRKLIKKLFVHPIDVQAVYEAIELSANKKEEPEKKKILVVDDSGIVLRSVKNWLEDKYQVVCANSGAMAIKYLAMEQPDLILLDYEMPICDGRQVLEMIRAESDFAKIPVIFLTNKNDKESVVKVSHLRPDGYLLKTMEPSHIVKVIDDFFENKD